MTETNNEVPRNVRFLMLLRFPILAVVIVNVAMLTGVPWSSPKEAVAKTEQQPQAASTKKKKNKTKAAVTKVAKTPPQKKNPTTRPATPVVAPAVDSAQLEAAIRQSAPAVRGIARLMRSRLQSQWLQTPGKQLARTLKRLANSSKSTATPVEKQLTVVNPASTGGVVHLRVNGDVASLQPGETAQFENGPWTIRFHRGADFGVSSQTYDEGRLEFSVGDEGWSLESPNQE